MQTNVVESQKLNFECYKHIATLNSATIVVSAGFARWQSTPGAIDMSLFLCFIPMLISLVASIFAMFKIAAELAVQHVGQAPKTGVGRAIMWSSILGYAAGLAALGVFLWMNVS